VTRVLFRFIPALAVAVVSLACASRGASLAPLLPSADRTLTAFKSAVDLQRAMDDVVRSKRASDEAERTRKAEADAAWQKRCREMERDDYVVVCGRSPTIDGMTISKRPIMEAALTNQHAGLEEGGVVKQHGNVLIVLRRGSLFTFAMHGEQLEPLSVANASGIPDADPADWEGWADELLVWRQTVIVIDYGGYRDTIRISMFDLDAPGRLRHREAYHLRSHDFLAASRHSARLFGNRLLLSTSTSVMDPLSGGLANWQPAIRRQDRDGAASPMTRLRDTRVMQPVEELDQHSQAHSVISCELAPSFRCEATVVLADSLAGYYVSPTAAYFWTSPWLHAHAERSILYRIPHDGGHVTAIGVRGAPSSQLSFLEHDGHLLNVAVNRDDGAWVLRLPLSALADGREDAPATDYWPVEEAENVGAMTRFVGPYVIAAVRDISNSRSRAGVVVMHRETGQQFRIAVPHDVHRLDVVDEDVVMIGHDDGDPDLRMTALTLGPEPALGATIVLPRLQASVGAHVDTPFYRKQPDGSYLIGLPVHEHAVGMFDLRDLPNTVVFVASRGRSLAVSGNINSEVLPDSMVENVQSFFADDRVFALMGGELVEGRQLGDRVEVVRRVDLGGRR
jgi:hypothetical protein